MAQHTFTASIHKEDDLYVATCVELRTMSQGDSVCDHEKLYSVDLQLSLSSDF